MDIYWLLQIKMKHRGDILVSSSQNDSSHAVPSPIKARIFFAIGPGDVLKSHQSWVSGIRHPSEVSMTYSGQSMDFCDMHGHEAMMVSSCAQVGKLLSGPLVLENRPKKNFLGRHGIGFFISDGLYATSLAVSAFRFGASVAVIDSGTSVWFMLWIFRIFGITVIPNFHNTLFPVGYPPIRFTKRFIASLDRWFFKHGTTVSMAVSPACARQYLKNSGARNRCFEYRGQFYREDFIQKFPVENVDKVFVLLYAGRIERNKGVFDLLDIVFALAAGGRRKFTLEICGDGPDIEAIRTAIIKRDLSHLVRVNGRLNYAQMSLIYRSCHLVIVPTRSDFCEGFAMVCAEGVLHHRPVVVSSVVPAIDVLGEALIEVQADSIASYVGKILTLMNDPVEYRRRVTACDSVADQFLDSSFGLANALQGACRSVNVRAIRKSL